MKILIKKILKTILTQNEIMVLKRRKNYAIIKILAYRNMLKTKSDKLFFKYFHGKKKYKVKIILVDFSDYPLHRKKRLFRYDIECGLGNLLENMTKFKAGVQFEVILVVNEKGQEKRVVYNSLKKYSFIEKIFFRDNTAFDFGAYNKGYQYLREIAYDGDIVFMNSSTRGPYNDYWLLKYSHLFHRRKNIGLCGISLNSHTTHLRNSVFRPHVQSFFMYTSMNVLMEIFNDSLPTPNSDSKKLDIITYCEIEFSTKMLDGNYGICSKLFENFVYYKGGKWRVPTGDLRGHLFYSQFANKI